MTVELFVNNSDNKQVGKSLTSLKTVDAILTENCTMEYPNLILHSDGTVLQANYCYISDWGRYYFINRHVLNKGERDTIECTVDVLQTYQQTIRDMVCCVTRQEHAGITNIVDPLLPLDPKKNIKCIKFNKSPFNLNGASPISYNFVLNVAGGAGGAPDPDPETLLE